MIAASLFLLAASAAPAQAEAARDAPALRFLVITFPDGYRGGRGRIKGLGVRPPGPDIDPTYHLLAAAQKCGAVFPMFSINYTHRVEIVSWSSAKDREVVACLRSSLATYFDAGVADPDPRGGYEKLDDVPFRDFWAASDPATAK